MQGKQPMHPVLIGRTNNSGSFLSKLGNFVGNVAGKLGKVLPGTLGTIARGVSNVFNDPAWWSSHPGDPVTTNSPLTLLVERGTTYEGGTAVQEAYPRAQFAEIRSQVIAMDSEGYLTDATFYPSSDQVNQFLLPHIRAVVNAIPLQSVKAYRSVLANNASLYAYWQTLKKWAYLAKHTPPYMHTFDDPQFPLLQSENAEVLQAQIKRVYEALSANVRLPHTLCEYIAWRFGRVYKSTNSAKAGFILYDALSIKDSVDQVKEKISAAISYTSLTQELQQANTDIYTVYASHDQEVHISDDTQQVFDKKEWMLRINLNVVHTERTSLGPDVWRVPKAVIIDSDLDNKTVFMASTVSTAIPGELQARGGEEGYYHVDCLFPVRTAYAYYTNGYKSNRTVPATQTGGYNQTLLFFYDQSAASGGGAPTSGFSANDTSDNVAESYFYSINMSPASNGISPSGAPIAGQGPSGNGSSGLPLRTLALAALMACKSLDAYNMGVWINAKLPDGTWANLDLTAISMDQGMVPADTIAIEQNYAAANLLDVHRVRSESKHAIAKEELRETVAFVNEVTPSDTTVKADVHPSI